MSDAVFDRRAILFRVTFAACVFSALLLIWSHRFLPISDYPDWIFQGSIAARLIQGKAPASYTFKHYPVPNSAVVVLLGALDLVFSPELSGKLVLSLCIVLIALSSTYLLRSIRPRAGNPLLLIPLLFLLNTYFFWGELNYLLGLALLFLYCGYLFRRTYRQESISWPFPFRYVGRSVSLPLYSIRYCNSNKSDLHCGRIAAGSTATDRSLCRTFNRIDDMVRDRACISHDLWSYLDVLDAT